MSTNKLRNEHLEFFGELEKRWDVLESKRTLKFKDDKHEQKRQKALHGNYGEEWTDGAEDGSQYSASLMSTSMTGSKKDDEGRTMPYAFLSAAEKQCLREVCQSSWDLASFIMCGIKFMRYRERAKFQISPLRAPRRCARLA